MEIVSSQIPHQFRNRHLRHGDSFMMTSSGGASGGASGSFYPHYIWGQYEDGQTDIVGDFVTEANVSIGGDLRVDSSVDIYGYVEVGRNVSIGGDLRVNSSVNINGRLSVTGNTSTANIYPRSNAAYSLGSSSYKYNYVYCVNSNSVNVTATNVTVSSTLTAPVLTEI